ncbi:MAG: hypothetical protein HKN93_00770 [Acidimicrobiia bacterium]|nr:hypothetical protein [Acidimicrobiia bacterium]
MTPRKLPALMLLLGGSLLALPGCSTSAGDDLFDCESGTCDVPDSEIEPHPCDSMLLDFSNDEPNQRTVNRLDDAFANKLFKAEADDTQPCPATFEDMVEKLKQTDNSGCNIKSFTVSEQGELASQGDGLGYRVVTVRQCDGRDDSDVLFSAFGFHDGDGPMGVDGSGLPDDVEVMAFDESSGVYNYYKALGDGSVGFFGNSKHYIDEGPAGPGLTSVRGCGNCHTGGGPIFKEMDSPWVHWNPDGGSTLVSNRSEAMGSKGGLGGFEDIIGRGHNKWNKSRVAHVRAKHNVAELLRPVFCPVEVNTMTGSKSEVKDSFLFDGMLSRADFHASPQFAEELGAMGRGISVDSGSYDLIIDAIGQDADGLGNDLSKPFSFVERSAADMLYIDELINAGLVDEELVLDILMVDFTRPVFSDARCGILGNADVAALELPENEEDQTPDAIRALLVDALSDAPAGTAEAQLVSYLENRGADHQATIDTFVAACEGRTDTVTIDETDVSGFQVDVMKLRSMQRHLVFDHEDTQRVGFEAGDKFGIEIRTFGDLFRALTNVAFKPLSVYEFQGALPSDDIRMVSGPTSDLLEVQRDAHLSPIDCQLTAGFVPVAVASSGENAACEAQNSLDAVCTNVSGSGNPLDDSCSEGEFNQCVQQVCADDEFCCSTDWNQFCVAKVDDICGITCD